jgi:hypothetical protein
MFEIVPNRKIIHIDMDAFSRFCEQLIILYEVNLSLWVVENRAWLQQRVEERLGVKVLMSGFIKKERS